MLPSPTGFVTENRALEASYCTRFAIGSGLMTSARKNVFSFRADGEVFEVRHAVYQRHHDRTALLRARGAAAGGIVVLAQGALPVQSNISFVLWFHRTAIAV